jgi:hypothetical protein
LPSHPEKFVEHPTGKLRHIFRDSDDAQLLDDFRILLLKEVREQLSSYGSSSKEANLTHFPI